jgi:hypothetical protein
MKLLTQELRQQLPPLYATEYEADPMVWCKFFTSWCSWTWYAVEFDGTDTFFGWVEGLDFELGYFSFSEMQQVIGPYGLKVERDLYFEPCRLSVIRDRVKEDEHL